MAPPFGSRPEEATSRSSSAPPHSAPLLGEATELPQKLTIDVGRAQTGQYITSPDARYDGTKLNDNPDNLGTFPSEPKVGWG